MEANLHLHSRYSDGSLWPAEMALRARETGLALAALTDHDSLGGVPEFLAAAKAAGLEALAGCEMDCSLKDLGYRSEILAYFPEAKGEGDYPATAAFLRGVARAREERLRVFVERSRALFRRSDLSFEELLARKLGASPPADLRRGELSFSKVDLFEYLKDKGLVEQDLGYREFRKAYFDSELIKDGRFRRADAAEVAAPVLRDGGILVFPHPGHQFGDDAGRMRAQKAELVLLLSRFRELGVSGVELYWYRNAHTQAINELVREAAEPLGYFFTYGSDCHGPGSGKHTLGQFSGDFRGFPRPPRS